MPRAVRTLGLERGRHCIERVRDRPVPAGRPMLVDEGSDVPDLPQVPMEDRTFGQEFISRDCRRYRPSMFLTVTCRPTGLC